MSHAEFEARDGVDPAIGSDARLPRLPLFLVLLGILLAVSLAPVLVFHLLTVGHSRRIVADVRQERQLEAASSIAQLLDSFLEQEVAETLRMARVLGTLDGVDEGTPLPLLSNLLDDTVVLARFSGANGQIQSAVQAGLVLTGPVSDALSHDAEPPWDGPAMRGPYRLGPPDRLVVTISAPVLHLGQVAGVLQKVVVFQPVWTGALNANRLRAPTRVFLLGGSGELVARTENGHGETTESLRRRELVHQSVRSGASAKDYTLPGADGSPCRWYGSLVPTKCGWMVLVEVEERQVLADVGMTLDRVWLGSALAAGLAIGAALLLGGWISGPMARLAASSKRLAGGDFSVQAGGSRVREVDELAANFNWMARHLGHLVERFRTAAREANDLFLGTIRALAEAIDEKDPYTKGHSIRVNRYAVIIGRAMGLKREDLRALHVCSLLHDVGKIGIDDAILNKPGALTPLEFESMKTHPERGAKIMARIPQMKNIIHGMRFHHERWSGGGYPLGLKGEEIPLQARIIAVADTFDAMITDRPYQKSLAVVDAVARINDLKGRTLDPQVIEAFNRAYEAGEFNSIVPAAIPEEPAGDVPTAQEETSPTGVLS
ncbi:MAG: HD domain-containing protein [Acidobacteria bacterium]|nr:HD domain-containing protein [Acidobacteriota bacterium]